jgi:hypothetical protein
MWPLLICALAVSAADVPAGIPTHDGFDHPVSYNDHVKPGLVFIRDPSALGHERAITEMVECTVAAWTRVELDHLVEIYANDPHAEVDPLASRYQDCDELTQTKSWLLEMASTEPYWRSKTLTNIHQAIAAYRLCGYVRRILKKPLPLQRGFDGRFLVDVDEACDSARAAGEKKSYKLAAERMKLSFTNTYGVYVFIVMLAVAFVGSLTYEGPGCRRF